MRFKIGLDGLPFRPLKNGNSAIAVLSEAEKESLFFTGGFFFTQLEAARKSGARTGVVLFQTKPETKNPKLETLFSVDATVFVRIPETDFLLDGVTRAGVKMLLNALSTCTMVRLGRVMGNTMIWVVASNLKLIDRATRYIEKLTGLTYENANRLLFEVIEYVEPRMKADQSYPPVVGLAVLRVRHQLTNEEAEKRFAEENF
jgi:N-acetylmuramic acid 6-phosphate (MurNAc-6-P) etherase